MIRISKKLREDCEQLKEIMLERKYPGSVWQGAIGAVYSSRDQEKTLADVKALLAQNLTPREMVVALQPIIHEYCLSENAKKFIEK